MNSKELGKVFKKDQTVVKEALTELGEVTTKYFLDF
jgi:hypothetical protein